MSDPIAKAKQISDQLVHRKALREMKRVYESTITALETAKDKAWQDGFYAGTFCTVVVVALVLAMTGVI